MNSKYCSINEIQLLRVANKTKSISIFHINACSLDTNFNDLIYLLKCIDKKIDVVAINETTLTRNTSKLCNVSLKNCAFESTPDDHQCEEHYFTLQITCLTNLVMN